LAIPNNINNEEIDLNLDSPAKEEEKKVLENPKEKEKVKEKEKEREPDKEKTKEKHREKEKDREKHKEKDKEREDSKDWKHKKAKRHKRSNSRSLSRSRSRQKSKSKNKHRNRSSSSAEKAKKHKKATLKEVEMGLIYDGRVTKVHDYGCFVLLENFVPKKEGLVHISNIRDKRITNAFEAVQRNQNVKVKVIAIAGSKISLSMKEVDQETGEELQKRPKNRLANVIFFKKYFWFY